MGNWLEQLLVRPTWTTEVAVLLCLLAVCIAVGFSYKRRHVPTHRFSRRAKLSAAAGLTLLVVLGIASWIGPDVAKKAIHSRTPKDKIQAWRAEFDTLDRKGRDKTAADELRRRQLMCMIRRRGLPCDEGLRDETIDHSDSLYALIVRKKWEWEDLFR